MAGGENWPANLRGLGQSAPANLLIWLDVFPHIRHLQIANSQGIQISSRIEFAARHAPIDRAALKQAQDANAGVLVAAGGFTPEAVRFAQETSVELVYGDELLWTIRQVRRQQG